MGMGGHRGSYMIVISSRDMDPNKDRRVIKGLRQGGGKKTNANIRRIGRCILGQPTHTMASRLACFLTTAVHGPNGGIPFRLCGLSSPTTAIWLQIETGKVSCFVSIPCSWTPPTASARTH